MGRHRAGPYDSGYHAPVPDRPHRKRRWPIAAFVAVLLIAAGWLGWTWTHDNVTHRTAASPGTCRSGNESIQVAVTPSIAEAVGRVASDWARTNPVVADRCVTVAVSALDARSVLAGLLHGWNVDQLGPKPDAWIADSTLWTDQLATAAVGDPPQSVATSPIVLALPPDAAKAVIATGAPTFAALPGVVGEADGWSAFGQPNWGPFTIALPDPSANAATTLALEAMLDPVTSQGQPQIDQDLLSSANVVQELAALAGSQPSPPTTSSHQALVSLGGADGIAHAPFGAVPVAEVDLYERNLGIDGDLRPLNVLDEVRLAGGTPFLDYPFTPLAGSWIDTNLVQAAESFRDFLLTAPEQAQLARSGFRVGDSTVRPDPSPGMDWGSVVQAPAPTNPAGLQLLDQAWLNAGQQH